MTNGSGWEYFPTANLIISGVGSVVSNSTRSTSHDV
jgi:hypothetical protein